MVGSALESHDNHFVFFKSCSYQASAAVGGNVYHCGTRKPSVLASDSKTWSRTTNGCPPGERERYCLVPKCSSSVQSCPARKKVRAHKELERQGCQSQTLEEVDVGRKREIGRLSGSRLRHTGVGEAMMLV